MLSRPGSPRSRTPYSNPLRKGTTVITFVCTACNHTYCVADDRAGKRVTCVSCDTALTIPVLAAPKTPNQSGEGGQLVAHHGKKKRLLVEFDCQKCVALVTGQEGQPCTCPSCGKRYPGPPGSHLLRSVEFEVGPAQEPAKYVRCRRCRVEYLAEPGEAVRCVPCGLLLRGATSKAKAEARDDSDDGRVVTAVRFRCPKCLSEYTADPGDAVRCVPCGQVITAPAAKPKATREGPHPVVSHALTTYEPDPSARRREAQPPRPPVQAVAQYGEDYELAPSPMPSKSNGGPPKKKWTGEDIGVALVVGIFGLFATAIFGGCIYAVFAPTPPKSPRRLNDDERIERMQREQRDLQDTNRWQQERLRADQWDKISGRKAGY